MTETKVVSTPLTKHFKLSPTRSPSTNEEKNEMLSIPYSSVVGSLMYAMICIRPDIAHAVGTVSIFLSDPGKEHWGAVKWILRYLNSTSDMELCFGSGKSELVCYTDSNLGGNLEYSKSTSGYLITFRGGAISCQLRLQKCIVDTLKLTSQIRSKVAVSSKKSN